MGIIYIARNTANGKSYVGQTVFDIPSRRYAHEYYASKGWDSCFCRALRKYGFSAFQWSVVLDDVDQEDLNHFETYFIHKLQTKTPHGYNMTDGGDGVKNPSIESRNKLAAYRKGKSYIEVFGEERALEIRAKKSFAHSEDAKLKIGAESKKRGRSRLNKILFTHRGRKHSEETKRNASNRLKGKSFEDLYGAEKAAEMKRRRSKPSKRKGKSFEEIYGEERSAELKKKISNTLKIFNKMQNAENP